MSSSARDNIKTTPFQSDAISADAKDEHATTTETSYNSETSYPDGGLQAWLVVLGSFCGMYVSTHMLLPLTAQ